MVTLFSCLTMFGGGVILTSCLTHMLPDVNEVWSQLLGQFFSSKIKTQVFLSSLESGNFPDSGLPVAEILVLAGFLMIYLLEEALHLLLVKCGPLKEDEKSGGEHLQPSLKITHLSRPWAQPRGGGPANGGWNCGNSSWFPRRPRPLHPRPL